MEPIVDLHTQEIAGYEVLYRSHDWLRRFPGSSAEWYWWYRRTMRILRRSAASIHPLFVTINADTRQLLHPGIFPLFQTLRGSQFVLEWTEHGGGDHAEAARRLVRLREENGIRLGIDDVGSGQDGLLRTTLLRPGGPDLVKLDGDLFQRAVDGDEMAEQHCRIVSGSVRTLRFTEPRTPPMSLIVEHIETETARRKAIELGAQYGQGYLWPARYP